MKKLFLCFISFFYYIFFVCYHKSANAQFVKRTFLKSCFKYQSCYKCWDFTESMAFIFNFYFSWLYLSFIVFVNHYVWENHLHSWRVLLGFFLYKFTLGCQYQKATMLLLSLILKMMIFNPPLPKIVFSQSYVPPKIVFPRNNVPIESLNFMQATHEYWCPLITSKLKSLKVTWCLYWYITQLYSLHCFHRQISSQRFSYIFHSYSCLLWWWWWWWKWWCDKIIILTYCFASCVFVVFFISSCDMWQLYLNVT